MVTPTRVLIRLGRGWSAIGTATLEADTVTGMKLLHLRLSAMAQDVYLYCARSDASPRLAATAAGRLRGAQIRKVAEPSMRLFHGQHVLRLGTQQPRA